MNFDRLISKFREYFNGSYGWDKLSQYLILGGILLSFTKITAVLGIPLSVYALWRSLSKDIYKRQLELRAFEHFLSDSKNKLNRYKYKLEDSKHFKIFKCPNCSQKLRVPRHKGKLTITCKKCQTEFKGKS